MGPLEVAVEALAGAVVRALRNTGVGRGAIANGYEALTADLSLAFKDPQRPARSLRIWREAPLEISVATEKPMGCSHKPCGLLSS